MTDRSTPPLPGLAGFTRHSRVIGGIDTVWHEAGDGPPLVFLHGTGTFTGFEMARAWTASHRVILPFHPGFGESADDPEAGAIEDYVLHYLAFLDALELDAPALAGFSVGGWMAAEIALRQPARIRALVLAAPAGLGVAGAPPADLSGVGPAEVPGYLAHDPAVALRYFPDGPDPEFGARLGREMGALGRLVAAAPGGSARLARWRRRLTMPVLLVWGAEDRMIPAAQAPAWTAGLPDAQTLLVPGAGHLVFEEKPETAARVADFLAAR
ncbi:alpha/beta fold hydrolase [Paroceanicella profunda]|uniref:Alpha/beta fold hydrolase n=1 Tax=Paroceanicella profunda TaxID=2579971 RepID=A0A5B8FVS1_9RHOB|nr:alpha/beta fold hydrolase [Paroceanicella profunda]QDL91484.1 alpha/beta fold hydrolase [Paroceanicella profunda]